MSSNNDKALASGILTRPQTAILAAVAERIFPRTETPGALEAGALDYICIALRGAYARSLPLYRRGLRALDRHAITKFGGKFAALGNERQDAVLADFEAGAVAGFKRAAEFFETVRYHVLEGVFCEPQYGGNKDMLGWRLVNFPGQQPGYPNAYIDQPVDLAPVAVDYRTAEED